MLNTPSFLGRFHKADKTTAPAFAGAAVVSGKSGTSISNCYNTGTITGPSGATGGVMGGVYKTHWDGTGDTPPSMNHCYTLENVANGASDVYGLEADAGAMVNITPNITAGTIAALTDTQMKNDLLAKLNVGAAPGSEPFVTDTSGVNGGYPILAWQAE